MAGGRLTPLDPLQGAQEQASSPSHHAALAASAGTGKTYVLTARVLRLLLRGVAPQSILCLTFTKAGSAEMAQRIHRRLAHWVRLDDTRLRHDIFALTGSRPDDDQVAQARTLFARVLEAPGGGLRVQTIHAFAQSLLAAFPAEAGLTPGFRPLEGREEKLLARTTLADMLVRAEGGGDLPLIADVQALSLRLGEKDAAGLLQACARVPEAMERLGAAQGIEPRLRDLFGLKEGDIEALVAAECCDELFDMVSLARVADANRDWGTATGLSFAATIGDWRGRDNSGRSAGLEDLLGVVQTGKGEPRKPSAGILKIDPDYADHAARLADCCQRLVQMRRTAAWVALASAGLRAGQAFARAYAEAKNAQGFVDFDDLIREAEKLLSTDGMGDWVRYKLDQQTDHILVDEAQDTNAAQWSIVAALAGEYFSGEGARGRHRTIFTVGDFKQAIFSFQGTDPQEFECARRRFESDARRARQNNLRPDDLFSLADPDDFQLGEMDERELPPEFIDLSMDRSFRSAPPVLAVVDKVIETLGHQAFGLPRAPEPHVSHKARLPGSVMLWRPYTDDGEDDEEAGEEGWVSERVRRYAGELARQVRAWLKAPFEIGSEKRLLQPQDILILVRSRSTLAGLIVARLHAEEVPVAGIDRLMLSAPLAVQDLLAAARFAIQPLDDLNLAALLVSPLIGWSQDDLYAAAFGREGALWPHLQAQARDLTPLRDMLGLADLATPHEFFEALLSGSLQGRRRLLARLGAEARDPIEELLSSALEFERMGTASLARFLDWFARGEVEIVRDPSAPLDAVRVMTVHGSKGLEAPVVILADACADPRKLGPGGRIARLTDDLPVPRPRKEELAEPLKSRVEDQDRRDREEHWRLLYVAMTRAKERLFVGGALASNAKAVPEDGWHRAIEGAVSGLGGTWEEDERWGAVMRFGAVEDRKGSPEPVLRGREVPIPTAPANLPAFLTTPAPMEERPPRPLAPSAIGQDEAAYPPPGPEQRREALRGKLLHRLFERLPDVPGNDRRARAEAWLARSGDAADPEFRRALIDDACRIIDDPRFAALFSPGALAEAPVAAVIGEGLVISGTVDRLLIADDRVLVADFKTGRRIPAAADQAPVSHLRQMAGYRAALRVIFPDRPVDCALVYTAAPVLLPLPDALLDIHLPGGA